MHSTTLPQQQRAYKLLGAEPSPFTAKIRAYLNWKRIPFTEVIASENVYKSLILPLTKVSFIPVLLVYDGSQTSSIPGSPDPAPILAIQDTKDMIDYFEHMDPPLISSLTSGYMTHPVMPPFPKLAFASMILELLGDEWLINQAIYWRWGKGNFEPQRDFLAFDYGSFAKGGMVSAEEAIKNGAKKLPRLALVLPLLGVTDATSPLFRTQFKRLLSLMSSHLSQHPFLLGPRISLADFAFHGSFYAHLARDPVPSYLIKTEAPLVFEWVERVSGLTRWAGASVDRWDDGEGKWKTTYGEGKPGFENRGGKSSAVPESATKIVELLLADYIKVLRDTLTRTLRFLDDAGAKLGAKHSSPVVVKLPRTLGRHSFSLGAATGEEAVGERNVYTHAIWMFDRIIKRAYSSVEQRAESDRWLETFESGDVLREWKACVLAWSKAGWRVERRENKLVARRREGEVNASL